LALLTEVSERCSGKLFLLILESLGSTELVFILIMALVFFGPRKLPQISRSLAKNLAEFRRASEDFKRTWDREVSLEDLNGNTSLAEQVPSRDQVIPSEPFPSPSISAISPEQVIARNSIAPEPPAALEHTDLPSGNNESGSGEPEDRPEHSPKNDWL
jgi:Tat protein translocase TatB subunit